MIATLTAALLGRTAHASPHAALDAGDRAWCDQDRQGARSEWEQAAEGEDPAITAMAELRLLLVSGNLGLMIHGPRADRALAQCPAGQPWCDLARADYALILAALGLPHDREQALWLAERAASDLPGPAQARRVWAGAAPVESLAALDRDGLGDGLLAAGGWPAGPGTWALTLGAVGAPGLGTGGLLRLDHPDVRWRGWSLTAEASLTSRGIGQSSVRLATAGRLWSAWSLSGGHLLIDNFATAETVELWTLSAFAAPGVRVGKWALWAGPMLRFARADVDVPGHGLSAGLVSSGPLHLQLSAEHALTYRHTLGRARLTAERPLAGGALVGQVQGAAAPGSQAPWWRLPSAGGGEVLRSAPAGRWRGEWLTGAALEWRHPLIGPLGGALFTEAAYLDGLHPGAGLGLRLALPPRPTGVARLDVARGEEGWEISGGWGQAL